MYIAHGIGHEYFMFAIFSACPKESESSPPYHEGVEGWKGGRSETLTICC